MTENNSNNKDYNSMSYEERAKLHVAKHKITGLYNTRAQSFLLGKQDWMKAANPSVEEVIRQLKLADERHNMWTTDINDAEVWSFYYMNEYQKYLSEIEFIPVSLSAE